MLDKIRLCVRALSNEQYANGRPEYVADGSGRAVVEVSPNMTVAEFCAEIRKPLETLHFNFPNPTKLQQHPRPDQTLRNLRLRTGEAVYYTPSTQGKVHARCGAREHAMEQQATSVERARGNAKEAVAAAAAAAGAGAVPNAKLPSAKLRNVIKAAAQASKRPSHRDRPVEEPLKKKKTLTRAGKLAVEQNN